MEFIKHIERLQLLNRLIRQKRTGSPEELARRLGISRAKLYLLLDELRDEGIAIRFSKRINSFVFENCDGIAIDFSLHVLGHQEMQKINAGQVVGFSQRLIF